MLTTVALAATLKSILTFDLPGPTGKRFDYLTIDYDDHYLLSAHLAAGLLYVIDLRTNQVVKAIADVPGAEGVEFVPELKKVYTSNAGDNTIGVIDLKQMKVVKKLPTEAKPDGSAYAAPFHKLYVSDERGEAEAIVDVQQDKTVRMSVSRSVLMTSTVTPLTKAPEGSRTMPRISPVISWDHANTVTKAKHRPMSVHFELIRCPPTHDN